MDETDEKEREKPRETNFDLLLKLRDAHNQTDSANPTRRTFPLSPTIFPCTIHFSRSITDSGKKYESFGDRPREIITKSGETISVSTMIENPGTAACHGLHLARDEKKTNGYCTSEEKTQITILSNAALPFSLINLKENQCGSWSGTTVIIHYNLSHKGDIMQTQEPYKGK